MGVATESGCAEAAPGVPSVGRADGVLPAPAERLPPKTATARFLRSLLDQKFKQAKAKYVLQCGLAMAAVLAVLLVLNSIANAAVMAALGASSFIAFTMPHTHSARARYMIGGYVVGIAVGMLCHGMCLLLPAEPASLHRGAQLLIAALSVGLVIFVMVITNTEHPPAASLTLGLVLGPGSVTTVAVVFLGIVLLCLIRRAMKPILMNLL